MSPTAWLFLASCLISAAAVWAAASARRREKLHARMLSFIAHEFNTPLTALNMTAVNFATGLFGPVSKEQLPWLVMLREQAARLSVLSGELRDFLHLELHGDFRLNPEPVVLERSFSECLEAMRDSLARSGAIVEINISDELPPISADPDRLHRVLSCVLSHAKKFRASGPISAKAAAQDDSVSLSIEYMGHKPFSPEDARALELYYPVLHGDSPLLESVGAGLGLARLLLAAQGGTMSMGPGQGGSCRITLGLSKASR